MSVISLIVAAALVTAGAFAVAWRLARLHSAPANDQSTLLLQRLSLLEVDRSELVRREPSVFRGLAIRCARCRDAERCARDLADRRSEPGNESWTEYCPNAPTLSTIVTWSSIGPPHKM